MIICVYSFTSGLASKHLDTEPTQNNSPLARLIHTQSTLYDADCSISTSVICGLLVSLSECSLAKCSRQMKQYAVLTSASSSFGIAAGARSHKAVNVVFFCTSESLQ